MYRAHHAITCFPAANNNERGTKSRVVVVVADSKKEEYQYQMWSVSPRCIGDLSFVVIGPSVRAEEMIKENQVQLTRMYVLWLVAQRTAESEFLLCDSDK